MDEILRPALMTCAVMNNPVYADAVLVSLGSPRTFLGRFLEGVDDPEARLVRGARVAALGFITGGLSAIPANLILVGLDPGIHLIEIAVLALGVTCLRIDWHNRRPGALYLIAVFATLLTAAASTMSTNAFAINYVFIVLALAVAAPFRVMIGSVAAITAMLFVPALVGADTGDSSLAFAIVGGPTLIVMALLAHELTRKLERSREAFWAMSREDELTGIGNYRALLERLDEEVARHARHGGSLTLILLDLDQFKSVNDGHGHLEGDRVLTAVAVAIAASIRQEDTAFRHGGDEFAVLAPETSIEGVEPVIERLRSNVLHSGPAGRSLTLCIGTATFPGDGTTAEELLSAADDRMMEPKRERKVEIPAGD